VLGRLQRQDRLERPVGAVAEGHAAHHAGQPFQVKLQITGDRPGQSHHRADIVDDLGAGAEVDEGVAVHVVAVVVVQRGRHGGAGIGRVDQCQPCLVVEAAAEIAVGEMAAVQRPLVHAHREGLQHRDSPGLAENLAGDNRQVGLNHDVVRAGDAGKNGRQVQGRAPPLVEQHDVAGLLDAGGIVAADGDMRLVLIGILQVHLGVVAAGDIHHRQDELRHGIGDALDLAAVQVGHVDAVVQQPDAVGLGAGQEGADPARRVGRIGSEQVAEVSGELGAGGD